MKKVTNYVMAVLCVGSLAFSTGAFMKVNASPAVTAEAPGQPVDLTTQQRRLCQPWYISNTYRTRK